MIKDKGSVPQGTLARSRIAGLGEKYLDHAADADQIHSAAQTCLVLRCIQMIQ
jgi:hypothetical protein